MKNAQRILKKVLSWVMVLAMVLSFVPTGSVAAAEAGDTLYLKPNSNWTQASARFAAYFFGGSGNTWVSMTDSNGDGIYEVTIPSGSWTTVIFCRMNPGSSTNSWDTKWDQTNDLPLPTDGTNMYTVENGAWSNGNGSWSTYIYVEPNFTYTVAGSQALCGTDWDTANTANDMTKNASGVYEKVYTDVAAGTYKFKVVRDHSWDVAWPGSDYALTVAEDGSTVTITFDVSTQTVNATVTAPAPTSYTVTFNGTHVTSSGAAIVEEGSTYTATLTADEGYSLPASVTVTVGGNAVTPTWDAATGALTVANVTGDVVITAAGVAQPVEPETITVYFENNWAWPDAKIYWWGSTTGTNPGWPGLDMIYVDTTEAGYDRYMIEVPTDITGMIFNGTGQYGAEQSADITSGWYDGICYYMTYDGATNTKPAGSYKYEPIVINHTVTFNGTNVTSGGASSVEEGSSYTATLTAAEGHDLPESITVTVGGTPVTPTWDAATGSLSIANVTGDVVITAVANIQTFTVTFNGTNVTSDGAESVSYGSNYTANLTAATGYDLPESVTVTVGGTPVTPTWDAATGALTVSAVTGDVVITGAGVAQPQGTTVYFINGSGWSTVKAYAWNASADNTWPGAAMTKTGETVNGFDVYSITFNTAYENIIFNNNNNGSQTADLVLQDGKYYDMSSGTWYDSLAAVPAVDPLATDATIAGSFNGWNTTTHAFKLNAAGENVGYVSLELDAATTYEFKIVHANAWYGNSGTITDSVQDWIFSTSQQANCQITTTVAGTYVFAYNLQTHGVSVTYPAATVNHTVTFNGTNVTSNGAATVEDGSNYTAMLTAAEGYTLPETISVTVGGTIATFGYDPATGSLSILNVTGDVVITAVGVAQTTEPEMITVYFRNDWLWSEVRVHYWGSASVADSTWPGVVMEKVGTAQYDGADRDVYAAQVPADASILFNGPENGNASNIQQTPDINDAQDGDAYYIHWADGNQVSKFDYTTGGEGGEPTENVEYEVIFHFADTLGWGTVNLYTWTEGGTTLTGQWPGTATTKDSTGYYSMTVKYEAPAGQGLNFIFNNGSAQTVDLQVAASEFVNNKAEKWVVLTTQTEGKYNAAIVDDPSMIVTSPVVDGGSVTFNYGGSAQSVSVAGSFNNWATTAMTKNADGVWTVTVNDLAAGDYQYKFVVDDTWIIDPMNGNVFTEEGGNQNSVFYILSGSDTEDDNTVTIRIHYTRTDGNYDGWNLWVWGSNMGGHQVDFDSTDPDGAKVATIVLTDARAYQDISFKERLSVEGNEWKDQGSSDRSIDLSTVVSGTIDYYIPSGSCVYGDDVIRKNKVSSVGLDYDNNAVIITTVQAISNPETALTLVKGEEVIPVTVTAIGSQHTMQLPQNVQIDLAELYQYKVMFQDAPYSIAIDAAYASDKFAAEYTYTGTDLGATYYSTETVFRVWAPTAESVSLKLYATGSDAETGAAELGTYPMTKDVNGTWIAIIQGDLKNVYYTYLVDVNGETVEANDPYSVATGVNGMRSMVTDLASTNPDGWDNDENPNKVTSQTDAIIYELHVRDFSIDASSGVSSANRGKFLAFTETGTTVNGAANAAETGIDYLKNLGITHLHLLPIYDYASVDETTCSNFNWGYDPQNYNVPEGSYSTNPYDGNSRVNEMKQMVMALHDAGISVVMDVVYNHVYDASTFSFNQIVPGYFSRVSSNASGCGNDTASEREMVRKYIVESVLYWTEEYHIDGFRFDLVGLLDVETINQIVTEVHKVRPDVIFYGEGWDMDSTNKEPGTQMAKQGNASKTPGFAYFSDSVRNGLAGDNSGSTTGFVSGAGNGGAMVSEWLGKPWWTDNPQQVVQYASCHDNYTLADKLILSTGKSTVDATVIKMNNLAAAFYMTSQGIPFIHAGEEILREKINADGSRNHNSYNSSDEVNHIDWTDVEKYAENSAYYQGLIAFRKAHPALRLSSAAEVKARVFTQKDAGSLIAFWIDGRDITGETHDSIYVILNASSSSQSIDLPAGSWDVCVNGTQAGTATITTVSGSVSVPGISAMVLVQETSTEEPAPGAVKSDLALPGSFNNWNTANFMDFAQDSTTVVTQTLTLPAGTYTFKIKQGDTWYGNGGTIEDTTDTTSATGWDMDASAGDCTLKATGGAYTFLFDTTTKKLIIKHDAEGGDLGDPSEYYLYGWINGADYAMGFETGDYKFDENGKLTVTFTDDSYVCVKNGDSTEKYMTDGWLGGVTSATMYDVNKVTGITGDKLMVPGGVTVTLTLVHNNDGTITLSYTAENGAVVDGTGVQDGVTLHCWNWSFAQIEANMALIAAQGYTAIQTSPVQVLKEATNLSYNSVGGNWWVYYQPVDFEITTDSGNALGTKDELASMIQTAHEYGIQVIVDVVANHLGNQTGNDLSTKIPEYLLEDAYWHDITVNTSDYNNRFDVTQHCMGGLPDLNTANDDIQGYVLDFLKDCVDMGVDGFRFDAAKHIETPEDDASFASDFWPTVVGGAESYAKTTYNKDLYIYGEMLDTIHGVPLSAYTQYMAITDNSWGNTLRNNVASGNAAISAGYDKAVDASVLVLWAESHDTYATDQASQSSAGVSEADIIKTWALVAARADAMGLYFARPASMEQAIGVASVTGWADPTVKAVNLFHNAFAGQAEVVSSENGICYVERGTTGVVLVSLSNARAAGISVTAHAMADGTYVDQITGNTFTVADGKITGQIGESGIAVVYNVTVAPETYDITVSETTGGTATADKATAEMGETVTVTVSADEGKELASILVTDADGKQVSVNDLGSGKYSFLQPDSDVTVTVTFQEKGQTPVIPDTYNVQITELTGGTVTADKTTAAAGETVTITVTPDNGKVVEYVIVTGPDSKKLTVTDLGDGKYSFQQPAGDVTVQVTFKAKSGIPGTGDETPVVLLCSMTVVSVLALAVLLLDQRKKHRA